MNKMQPLFAGPSLWKHLEDLKNSLQHRIQSISRQWLDEHGSKGAFQEWLRFSTLKEPQIHWDGMYRSEPVETPDHQGLLLRVSVPITGEDDYFVMCPHRPYSTEEFPLARIELGRLEFELATTGKTHQRIHYELEATKKRVNELFEETVRKIREYNAHLPSIIDSCLNKRINKLALDDELVRNIKIPLQVRTDAPETYRIPITRTRVKIHPLPNNTKDYVVDEQIYEEALALIRSMTAVMERSPRAFRHLEEEDLRFNFLFQLNSRFEGAAMGEVFNFRGKTDILIRYKNKNAFIAECKFWKGARELVSTIDQLLRYTTWRDTKTAIILFNRNKDFGRVLEEVRNTVPRHAAFIEERPSFEEAEFRYVFRSHRDESRRLLLTVLCFDVPRLRATSKAK